MRRILIRLTVDFWTWRRLNVEGMDDGIAADLMTEAIASVTTMKAAHRKNVNRSYFRDWHKGEFVASHQVGSPVCRDSRS